MNENMEIGSMEREELIKISELVWSQHRLECLLEGEKLHKIKVKIPGINEMNIGERGPFATNINPTKIEEGQSYYLLTDKNKEKLLKWLKIDITHVYGGVIHYRIEGHKEEEWMPEGCMNFIAGYVQPIEYIVDREIYPPKRYRFIKSCPYTKIIYQKNS